MKNILDPSRDGWDAITDIACPIAQCPGQLRWAEAGHAPGHRICDCCGSHFTLDRTTQNLALQLAKRLRPTPAKIAAMHQTRAAAAAAEQKRRNSWLQQRTDGYAAEWETNHCAHGAAVSIPHPEPHSASHADITQLPGEYQALIRTCWEITARLRLALPMCAMNPPSACCITKDGAAVMVYHVTHTYGWWDGWWHIDALVALLADDCKTRYSEAAATAGKLTAEERKARGIFR